MFFGYSPGRRLFSLLVFISGVVFFFFFFFLKVYIVLGALVVLVLGLVFIVA